MKEKKVLRVIQESTRFVKRPVGRPSDKARRLETKGGETMDANGQLVAFKDLAKEKNKNAGGK